jgi:hypothetical protein
MPDMSLIRVRGTLASQDMKRREFNVLDAADRPTIVLMAVETRAFLAMDAVLSCGLSRAIRD